ncbi:histidine kinase/DNA gyrase B/HSP90-like ATPase [Streptohalobacillus salinus]|uniref:histidine kinase n=1 Tax=Streptohalobacillus salinus TaxID=621096 RepID=A0A2V3WH64_9BACI|nr:sensor histidine kinase [Streptohalobacillus salinus]PXW93179.1 histidine kinase/DNA gyrase B/HSP90-like ATPase [Streptohalobacillus salinus]
MHTIKRKVTLLAGSVIVILLTIWISLTFFNRQTQAQYNVILERYLVLNEVNQNSQLLMTDLNAYLNQPTEMTRSELIDDMDDLLQQEHNILKLEHQGNHYPLTNYINLVDSLIESMNRSLSLFDQDDPEAARLEFDDATRIQNYISETTLGLLNQELTTYEDFYRNMIGQSVKINRFGIWLLLLLVASVMLVTYLFQKSITRPIHQLTDAANALSRGEFDEAIYVDSKDELAFLGKTFNRMRININQLIEEIQTKAQLEKELQENKLLLQASQFRSLQSQINPHFLFNTLNTVSKKAYLEGSVETSDLLVNVADLLRYNLKQVDREVTLKDEIEVLRQYIAIQQARFGKRLHYVEIIDQSALDLPMPALTLQPIVENAVIHAIEKKREGGTVTLEIQNQADIIQVTIKDDGPGMTKETKQQLLDGSIVPKEGHSTGIGFNNVVKRLKLFYEADGIVTIDTVLSEGTAIHLTIPKIKG